MIVHILYLDMVLGCRTYYDLTLRNLIIMLYTLIPFTSVQVHVVPCRKAVKKLCLVPTPRRTE
jgi:hypothetical protein